MTTTRQRWLILIAAALLVKSCIVAVDETQYVILTRFGKPVRVIKQPGAHLKLPYQAVRRFDKRVRLYSPRPSEFLTKDKKNLVVDNYLCWSIEDPQKFLETVSTPASAEMRLHDVVWSTVSAEIGRTEMAGLVSDEPGDVIIDQIQRTVTDRCQQVAAESFGIRILDVRIRRLNFPDQNKQSVFKRMRAERERIAKQYRAEGEEEAQKIRAEADKQKEEILSEAYRQAETTRGEGDAVATRIYAEAYGKDPSFFKLQRTLDSYRKFLNKDTTVVLSGDSELLRLLSSGRPTSE